MSHADIIRKFASRKINSRTKDCTWTGFHVFSLGDVLYSYGTHFPMAVFMGKEVFLKNGDKYSDSTSAHQSITNQYCIGPTVSRSRLRDAGFNFEDITLKDVVCYQSDMSKHLYLEDGKYWEKVDGLIWEDSHDYDLDSPFTTGFVNKPTFSKPFNPPKNGTFVPYNIIGEKCYLNGDYTSGRWEVIGGIVLAKGSRYFLASKDEEKYFVAELPKKPRSVRHAFDILKPKPVIMAEKEHKQVFRLGEWFFIPTGYSDKEFANFVDLTQDKLKALSKPLPLPIRNDNYPYNYVCKYYWHEGIFYATGNVVHRTSHGYLSGLHRVLRLKNQWYKAYINTALEYF